MNNFPTGNAPRTISVFFKLDPLHLTDSSELFAWGDSYVPGNTFGMVVFDTLIGFRSVDVPVIAIPATYTIPQS